MPVNNKTKIRTKTEKINLAGILNSMRDAYIIIIDSTGMVLFVNDQLKYHNFLDNEIDVGAVLYDALPDEKRASIRMMIDHLFATGEPFRTHVETMKEGIKVHFEFRYSPVMNDMGKVTQVLIEGRDVSGEKIFSNKIKRVSGDFSSLVENANAIIIGTDSMGYITDWNEKSYKVTGYDKQETFAKMFQELLKDEESKANFSILFHSILKGEPLNNYEITIVAKDGESRILLVNATPRKNVLGQVDGVLFVGQDVTELITYRASLEQKVLERTEALNKSNLEIKRQKEATDLEKVKSDQLLLNILPEFVAKELKEKGHVIPRHFKSATILFADLVGFTTLCKGLSPEQILYELNYIFVGFDMIIEKYGLEKIKTIGDGYMAVGGLPVENTTHASDAVNAGLKMIEYVKRVGENNKGTDRPPWQARVGIHSGELTAGVIGRSKFTYDVWGGSVNTASRMESTCEGGKVNISSATYELVKNEFHCIHRGPIKMKNMGELQMYYVSQEIP